MAASKDKSRLAVLWVTLFVIQFFANLIEGSFFTTRISTEAIFIGGTFVGLTVSLAEAMAVVFIFKPRVPIQGLVTSLKSFFANRRAVSWLEIIILASAAYFPVYFTFGGIVSPFVLPYYTNPSNGLSLAIPTLPTIVVVELLRGFLFVGALLPILATSKASNRAYFLSLASLFFIAGGLHSVHHKHFTAILPEVRAWIRNTWRLSRLFRYSHLFVSQASPVVAFWEEI